MNFKLLLFCVLSILFFTYSVFVYTSGTELAPALAKISPSVAEGKLLWQKHNCIACHQLYGLGGYLGPDLTTVISKKGALYARAFILNGTQRMPDFHLTEAEIQALIDYLGHVNATATTYNTDGD